MANFHSILNALRGNITRFTTLARSPLALRLFAATMALAVLLFLANNYFVYWLNWSEFSNILRGRISLTNILQLLLYTAATTAIILFILRTPKRNLRNDADAYAAFAAYIIRASYWAVLLIGLIDMLISFLRVEDFLAAITGKDLATQLGRPTFRGAYIHYPLILAALIIARYSRSLGFIWLPFLVVLAEFQVVVSRFVFSYEQAFMGDLVRFWYAALFLFASAYTLAHEGHVRVDVLYANFTARGKALVNTLGAILLGLPVCWTILWQGMSSRNASIASPLLGFEISQSGYGLYVKYLMAGFLLIFAFSMTFQFIAAFLRGAAELQSESNKTSPASNRAHKSPNLLSAAN